MFKSNGTSEKYFKVINKIGDDTSKHLKILTKNIMEHEKNMSENSIANALSKIATSIEDAASIAPIDRHLYLRTPIGEDAKIQLNLDGIEGELAGLSTSINNVAKAIDAGARSLEAIASSIIKAAAKKNMQDIKKGE